MEEETKTHIHLPKEFYIKAYKYIQISAHTHTHTRPQVVLVYIYTYRVFDETHYCSTENEKRLIYFQSLNEINRKIAF